jgi:hypothetical protein
MPMLSRSSSCVDSVAVAVVTTVMSATVAVTPLLLSSLRVLVPHLPPSPLLVLLMPIVVAIATAACHILPLVALPPWPGCSVAAGLSLLVLEHEKKKNRKG